MEIKTIQSMVQEMTKNLLEGLKPGEAAQYRYDPQNGVVRTKTIPAEEKRLRDQEFSKKFTPDFRLRALAESDSLKSRELK